MYGAAVGAVEIHVRFAVAALVFLQLEEALRLGDQAQIALTFPPTRGQVA